MKIGWGIDVGVASLGFAVIELDAEDQPASLIDGITLVYSAPTGGADRTRYKSMRTQNKRRAKRIKMLRAELTSLFKLNPGFDAEGSHPDLTDGVKRDGKSRRNTSRVRLRAHGLTGPLSEADLARAILHIAKNRGRRLTRGLRDNPQADAKEQEKSTKENQSVAETANATKEKLKELGKELGLHGQAAHPSQLLMNKQTKTGITRLKKDRAEMPVFTRTMVQAELDALLTTQQRYHESELTGTVCKKLKEMIFKEAERKKPSIGKCRYGERDANGDIETRLPRGSDLFQRKRIFEEVNNLRLICSRTAQERVLTIEQRDRIARLLLDGRDLTAKRVRNELGLGQDALADMTSLDISRRGRKTAGKLYGHPLSAAMRKADALEQWQCFDESMRESIADLVRTEDEIEVLHTELKTYGLETKAINQLSRARLPAAYSTAGKTATRKLLRELEADVISNHEAEDRAELKSLDPPPPRCDRLPYYGEVLPGWCVGGDGKPGSKAESRLGRIPNPVVHVALNQLRKTANSYLRLYGKPLRICIELARDLNKSAEDRERIEKQAAKNRRDNESYIEELEVEAHKRKLKKKDRQRLKLHKMQGGECLYSGSPISVEQLFDGSSVEVDHILPYADTGDDQISNLALVFAETNQFKAKRPPFMAFHPKYLNQDYAHIFARARKRGGAVLWRFKENAMERYKDRNEFKNRYLNDTRYIAKMARRYLSCICAKPSDVVCLNGRITSALRRKWGLHTVIRDIMIEEGRLVNADIEPPNDGETLEEMRERRKRADKIRWDHRHHLLDAIVAACTTRSDVQRLQTLAAQHTDDDSASEILARIRRAEADFRNAGICWRPEFRKLVKAFLQGQERKVTAGKEPVTSVVVKADHDPRGQLHEATNYGLICEVPGQADQYVVRYHVSIMDWLKDAKRIEELGVPDTAIHHVKRAKEQGARFWWGGQDPVSALSSNLRKDLAELRARLLELIDATPPEALEKVSTDGGRNKARVQWAKEKYIAETKRRRFTRVEVASLRILKGPLDRNKKPRQANPTGGNDRLIYFVNGEGDRELEVVSTLDANTPGFIERWRREGGHPLFVLRKGDLVEMAADPSDSASPRRIYRMVSFSDKGKPDLEFVPVEEARPARPPKSVRVISNKAFSERAPVLVVCDPTGRERWRSRRLN